MPNQQQAALVFLSSQIPLVVTHTLPSYCIALFGIFSQHMVLGKQQHMGIPLVLWGATENY